MLPGNVDPRRPDKIQRLPQKPSTVPNGGNAQEDLTPDYMNIMGQQAEASPEHQEDKLPEEHEPTATNVIPTSDQYGVAIMNPVTELEPPPVEPVEGKPLEDKDIHSTPSRNDRFKVVKIASLEPFKRGRWKCMDYQDEAPPQVQQKLTQASGTAPGVFVQATQSMPQQQIQQLLMQGYTNGAQFFPAPTQMMPQPTYFYPPVANMQTQTLPQQVPSSLPAQFINSGQQYYPATVVANAGGFTIPPNYNMQYMQQFPNQNSAFVPTSQNVQLPASFQQSQTYAGQPAQSLVNGHGFQNEHPAPQTPASLPTQTAKTVIMNSTQNPVTQTQSVSSNALPAQTAAPSTQYNSFNQTNPQQNNSPVVQPLQVPVQNFDQSLASNMYTNPQFTASVPSLTVLEGGENETEAQSTDNPESSDDPAKTNPVVNAIDNKIEQAMDLVKSHLMYTVREEVEVLKEKIADLMEKIQQLETENNYLKSQIPKGAQGPPSNGAAASGPASPAPASLVNAGGEAPPHQ